MVQSSSGKQAVNLRKQAAIFNFTQLELLLFPEEGSLDPGTYKACTPILWNELDHHKQGKLLPSLLSW